jgi:hypothetical protein
MNITILLVSGLYSVDEEMINEYEAVGEINAIRTTYATLHKIWKYFSLFTFFFVLNIHFTETCLK